MKKDVTSKLLENQNDVFADIFNNLYFDDDRKIFSDNLTDEPTESFYTDVDGNARNMFRDVFKRYSNGQGLLLVSLGLENEAQVERPMAIRVMGYEYTNYKKQLDEYNNSKKALLKLKKSTKTPDEQQFVQDEIERLGQFVLIPTLTLVLCYDDKKWNQPKTLKELTNGNPYAGYMQDYGIKVVDIKHLP